MQYQQLPDQVLGKLVREEDKERKLDEEEVPVDGRTFLGICRLSGFGTHQPVPEGTGIHRRQVPMRGPVYTMERIARLLMRKTQTGEIVV